ncbi:hypothetical protein [Lentzea sp.]|uniref:hypothetical protein n=1 Tax=Lentzea sp. TaxID=56099 RepID=UPI002ED21A8E
MSFMPSAAELIERSLRGDNDALESRARYNRSYSDARPWLYCVVLNKLRRHRHLDPVREAPPDLAGVTGDRDPWPAVDSRVVAQVPLRKALTRLRPEERGGAGSGGLGGPDRRGDHSSVLTINADNGLPVREEYIPAGNSRNAKYSHITFRSSRVNLADVAADKI